MSKLTLDDRLRDPEISAALGTRTLVVGPYPSIHRPGSDRAPSARSPEARFEEAEGLARAIDLNVVASERLTLNVIRRQTPELGDINVHFPRAGFVVRRV